MEQVFRIFFALLNVVIFLVGCWEAEIAAQHEPTLHTSPGEKQGYAFTVISAFVNIGGAVLLTCVLLCGKKQTEEKEETSNGCLPHCALFVWCCVLFAGIFNHDIRTGPFQEVVIAQFSMAMVGISLLCCLGCCGALVASCTTEKKPVVENPITVEV